MRNFFRYALVFLSIWSHAEAQDTLNLLPPVNLQAIISGSEVLVSWEAPVDTTGSTDTIPQGLIGYRIYADNVPAGYVGHPDLVFTFTSPATPVSFYKAAAVYDLTAYGYPGDTAESVYSNLAFVITDAIYQLPFSETFYTGIFETNEWTVESQNWIIAGQAGNQAPSAGFYFNPIDTSYSSSLISPWIDGSIPIDGRLFIDFDLLRQSVNQTGTEYLSVEVYNGNEWIEILGYSNIVTGNTWAGHNLDITNEAFGKPFRFRFRAFGENSMNILQWLIDNIEVYRKCMPPEGLVTSIPHPMTNPCELLLEWLPPLNPGQGMNSWLFWDNGNNADAIGLTGGGTFKAAVRFTPTELGPYVNFYLTKIRFFPYNNNALFTLKVWTGFNATQLMVSQVVNSYTAGEWNEVTLNTPFLVTLNDELWIGYEITHPSGVYAAGVDDGPAISGYGDLISLDGVVWESMSAAHGLDYNWNIECYVTNQSQNVLKSGQSLLEYRIYRNNEYLTSTTGLSYIDNYAGFEWPCYKVTAVYADCESAFSNLACIPGTQDWCNVGVDDILPDNINAFPNPASDIITVTCNGDISKLTLINMTGQRVADFDMMHGSKSIQIPVACYPRGLYSLRFETTSGKFGGIKIVID
jgi:hypothetical protein